ncbi:MAG: DUF1800 family protein [Saprospiraceae bacterium]|nr:DUF1800 family protein [Saprospiraceae bacterium]
MASLNPLQGALGRRRAAHLLRRTSFRYTKAKLLELADQTAAQALPSLLTANPFQLEQPVYGATNATWILPLPGTPVASYPAEDFVLRRYVMGWWLNEALHDPGITHKMSLFFHQFMAVAISASNNQHYFDYLSLMRWGALGNFKKLATKLVTDNAMLRYLNNTQNTKNNPNENFAREFFELFTIGKGPQIGPGDYSNYTEDDIVEAAKVLTGFRIRPNRDEVDTETGIPRGGVNPAQHATGNKTFSAHFQGTVIAGEAIPTINGMWTELGAFVDMIFAQPETAKNLCRRLYRYFVNRNVTDEIENDIIGPLASTLMSNNYEIKPVLEQLLQSEHFFDVDDSDNTDEIIGGIIKSPLDLTLQALSFFDVAIPDPMTQNAAHYMLFYSAALLERALGAANLPLFSPSDVAGYPAFYQEPIYHRLWFNSSTIIARYKWPAMLLTGTRQIGGGINQPIGVKLNSADWVRNSGVFLDPSDPYVLVQDLLEFLLPEEADSDRFNYFYIDVFLDGLPPADWTYEWQAYISSGNATEVSLALDRLIQAVMFSPEYQTC